MTESRRGAPPTHGLSRLLTDPEMLALPERTRLTALGLWQQHVDRQGTGPADPTLVRESVWPTSASVTDDDVLDDLVTLGDAGWLALVDGPRGALLLRLEGWPFASPESAATAQLRHSAQGVVGEKEGRGERGSEAEAAPAQPAPIVPVPLSSTLSALADLPEPAPWCSRHQPWGTDDPCGPCGSARKRHELWKRAIKENTP
ncbi:hypothetical protein [Cellulosimicrobium sp. JZ28]|uniref:hypothetical protein n=1 Tax=Cellulosimicrobium sp. JZ28 TaxID=1906273 RepID=UPI00188AF845|nr:hypothetical protein [Cellulosimicrobium sp. JZ28]